MTTPVSDRRIPGLDLVEGNNRTEQDGEKGGGEQPQKSQTSNKSETSDGGANMIMIQSLGKIVNQLKVLRSAPIKSNMTTNIVNKEEEEDDPGYKDTRKKMAALLENESDSDDDDDKSSQLEPQRNNDDSGEGREESARDFDGFKGSYSKPRDWNETQSLNMFTPQEQFTDRAMHHHPHSSSRPPFHRSLTPPSYPPRKRELRINPDFEHSGPHHYDDRPQRRVPFDEPRSRYSDIDYHASSSGLPYDNERRSLPQYNEEFDLRPQGNLEYERRAAEYERSQRPRDFERSQGPPESSQMAPDYERSRIAPEYERSRMAPEYERSRMAPEYERSRMAPEYERSRMAPDYERSQMGPDYERSQMGPDYERSRMSPDYERSRMSPDYERSRMVPDYEKSKRVLDYDRLQMAAGFERSSEAKGYGREYERPEIFEQDYPAKDYQQVMSDYKSQGVSDYWDNTGSSLFENMQSVDYGHGKGTTESTNTELMQYDALKSYYKQQELGGEQVGLLNYALSKLLLILTVQVLSIVFMQTCVELIMVVQHMSFLGVGFKGNYEVMHPFINRPACAHEVSVKIIM